MDTTKAPGQDPRRNETRPLLVHLLPPLVIRIMFVILPSQTFGSDDRRPTAPVLAPERNPLISMTRTEDVRRTGHIRGARLIVYKPGVGVGICEEEGVG